MPSTPKYDPAALLLQLSESDESAFRQIFDTYSPRIHAFALRLTGSPVLAEEIVQEVFTSLWQYRHEAHTIRNTEAWLVTVARNTGSSMLRRLAHERLIIHELQSGQPLQTEEHTEEWRQYHHQLQRAVEALPPQQRKVWELSRQRGMKQQQIAEEMGLSIHTVKEYIKKATVSLKKNLLKILFWGIPSFFLFICLL
ncbi:RNA polymerase sigma-70 factor [Pseudoflavitalea sp. G-6-1-2]|uniref:RNA polymerase sigma factor n=1 Tax=Pseudoflavitalea sp. G-6-1-2 TaxID=2728841 RepID=UPI00146C19B9|nr:RNA polymerase sigma-70 factor [Pseudoflavitalea sp. G-6-1-2]NML22925.1 RNA polymerase sigma-70 factor [Pseudoflavitalea sp. G-6-1-2]